MSLYSGMTVAQGSNSCLCDLRSDTMTSPDAAMREAIAAAVVGDDVYGEDPTVQLLEQQLAELLGKDAAVFFPTGTQSNLAAVMAHCGRGDEVIIGNKYHIYCDEAAGVSVLAGVSMNAIPTNTDGSLSPAAVEGAIKDDDPHYARSRLLCLENTVGGQAISLKDTRAAADVAWNAGLQVHLDGARFFNAITALGCTAKELASCVDSISVCLSKGLGAPLGSVLIGSGTVIAQARRNRKILGGSMRQSGIAAAAGIFALENNLVQLAEDHKRAIILRDVLYEIDLGGVIVHSNMVFFTPMEHHRKPLHKFMADRGILIGGQSPAIRMVLHKDVTETALKAALDAFSAFYSSHSSEICNPERS